jgi:transposase
LVRQSALAKGEIPAGSRNTSASAKLLYERYLGSSQFPERKGRSDRGRSLLDPYKDYFLKRWNSGCHEAKKLFHELQAQDYAGSYATVARYAQRLRQVQGLEPRRQLKGRAPPKVIEDKKLPLTVGRATWLVLRRPENRDPEDEQLLARLIAQHPDLAEAISLSQEFAQLVRNREPEQLDIWLARAVGSHLGALVRFANRLGEDYEAVKAGVTLEWSNGQVEGQINRLKMLKRQMYGRASLDLLSQRFLLAV